MKTREPGILGETILFLQTDHAPPPLQNAGSASEVQVLDEIR